ncbi:glutaredoxin family protein [uncultured Nocardioides sp.]|uniref:glutaredoxin family protein n=1 Tax=uncultured Nocardioides sp. TaxID=198441 RepID=UPI00260BBBBF|nr:glutaredoxin family protein [uncultured Nocardioides sp.]
MDEASAEAGTEARVRFVTRDGCHLCEEARAVVAAVCAELGERFVEVDVDEDPSLLARYDEQVPVTFVDGRQHDFWRVDAGRLRRALTDGGRVG